jgi:hypothetical protein
MEARWGIHFALPRVLDYHAHQWRIPMSTIRLAFTAATTGTLQTVTSTMSVVATAADMVDNMAKTGQVYTKGWHQAALMDQAEALEDRLEQRREARAIAAGQRAKAMAKLKRELEADPLVNAIYLEITGAKPKLSVAAE